MNKNIVLASGSPRRKQLLDMCGLEFDVITADLDEEIIEKEINSAYSGKQSYYIAEKMVERLSREKALVVKDQAEKKYGEDYIVIGSDTLVVDENQILGKPKDKDDAYRILRSLCGKLHRVYTGVSLVYDDRVESFVSHTEVLFYDYDQKMEDIINKYI